MLSVFDCLPGTGCGSGLPLAVVTVSADKGVGRDGPLDKGETQSDVRFFTDPKVQRKKCGQGEWGRRWAQDTKQESKEVLPAAS